MEARLRGGVCRWVGMRRWRSLLRGFGGLLRGRSEKVTVRWGREGEVVGGCEVYTRCLLVASPVCFHR